MKQYQSIPFKIEGRIVFENYLHFVYTARKIRLSIQIKLLNLASMHHTLFMLTFKIIDYIFLFVESQFINVSTFDTFFESFFIIGRPYISQTAIEYVVADTCRNNFPLINDVIIKSTHTVRSGEDNATHPVLVF